MEYYIFLLVVLFGTAISDLYVGVSNDAVNFMNSAVGSKVGSRFAIILTASAGVFIGTTFSTGMMEVARKGIFNPEMFVFHEVMVIFLAVMLTDIILLDLYNTFSLPTSTTVSLVFELIGGAVAMSWIKVQAAGGNFADVFAYLNTSNVVAIVSSIGVSVVLAFVCGVTVQFIVRFIFTFDYARTIRRYGALFGAAGILSIVYFILAKGAKSSSLLSDEQVLWIGDNLTALLGVAFVAAFVFFQAMLVFARIDILRVVVFAGTFALALAFAANDLVNFIGSPVAALQAFDVASSAGGDPMTMTMESLARPVRTNPAILLGAGVLMVVTLAFSRKARAVTKTEVALGRQEEGVERFNSSPLARSIVRMGVGLHNVYRRAAPITVQRLIAERIDPSKAAVPTGPKADAPAFDLLRAAVNLMVASSLISVGTSLKLPLSTTFVTFMVAMSTSFADKSWGRESAVYRVNGVIFVIGGWFFTAMLAFFSCVAFTFAIYFGGLPAILALVLVGFTFFYRSGRFHEAREAEFDRKEKALADGEIEDFSQNGRDVAQFLKKVSPVIKDAYDGLTAGNRRMLKNASFIAGKLSLESEKTVASILEVLKRSADEEKGITPRYGRKIASLQIIVSNLTSLTTNVYSYVDNNHTPPDPEQVLELREVRTAVDAIIAKSASSLETGAFDDLEGLSVSISHLKETIREFDRRQVKRIKLGRSKTRQSLMFIGTLNKAERIADQAVILARLYGESTSETELQRSEAALDV